MKTFLSAIAATFLFAALSLLSPAHAQYQPGQCATLTNGGRMETIVGPSNVQGQWMVRDARLATGSGQSLRPEEFTIVPCPMKQIGATCFESTQDASGNNEDQRQVIHALRTRLESAHRGIFRVRIDTLDIGVPREPSYQESQDILSREEGSKVVDIRAAFQTCADDGAQLRYETHEWKMMCYNSELDHQLTCGSIISPDVVAPQVNEVPKFPQQP